VKHQERDRQTRFEKKLEEWLARETARERERERDTERDRERDRDRERLIDSEQAWDSGEDRRLKKKKHDSR
jgi:hypothetical protein